MFQDSAPLVYDSGNYLPTLEQAAEMIGYEQFLRDEQPRLRAAGQARRRRHRVLRRRHGHRAVRRRARDGRAERHGARRDRRRHAGPGPLHGVRADRRGRARRRASRTCGSSPATRASFSGAPARSPAAARWSPAARAMRPRSRCARRFWRSPSQLLGARRDGWSLATAASSRRG